MTAEASRRELLQACCLATGAFALGFVLPACGSRSRMADEAAQSGRFVPSAWLTITPEDKVIFTLDRVEMGQGTMTSHAMLVAEELEVEPGAIEVRFAEASRAYDNPDIGFQITGGSTSVKGSFRPLRTAAATAREMLRSAAAASWGVPAGECVARAGAVEHPPSGRRAPYGSLTRLAAAQPIPAVRLKDRSALRVLGKPVARLDLRAKVNGSAVFGLDVRRPGQLYAVLVRPPALSSKVARFDAAKAQAVPGVKRVFAVTRGVAVVADSSWRALKAARLVHLEATAPEHPVDTDALTREHEALLAQGGKSVRSDGDARGALSKQPAHQATYHAPHLAHATMEPMNATAWVHDGQCEVWAPTQSPALAREAAARAADVSASRVAIHTTFLGGGFGRRLDQDYVADAVEVARAFDVPVQVLWPREDDTTHDFYRPAVSHRLRGTLDGRGAVAAWEHRVVGPSIVEHVATSWARSLLPDCWPAFAKSFAGSMIPAFQLDQTSVEGAIDNPYGIPHLRVEYTKHEPHVPIGFWRSVGHSHAAFAVESFVDELAHRAGKDPYAFRRALLAARPRHLRVLDLAASKAGWGSPLPAGRGRGLAVHASFDSYCAQVAEVSVEAGAVRVHRVVTALDCGLVVNPDIVAAQLESAVVFGLGAALKQRITLRRGVVQERNFNTFPALRMHETPQIEVHLVASDEPPTGVGEPGLPPVAPAVANALFAATGQRLRTLPLRLEV